MQCWIWGQARRRQGQVAGLVQWATKERVWGSLRKRRGYESNNKAFFPWLAGGRDALPMEPNALCWEHLTDEPNLSGEKPWQLRRNDNSNVRSSSAPHRRLVAALPRLAAAFMIRPRRRQRQATHTYAVPALAKGSGERANGPRRAVGGSSRATVMAPDLHFASLWHESNLQLLHTAWLNPGAVREAPLDGEPPVKPCRHTTSHSYQDP